MIPDWSTDSPSLAHDPDWSRGYNRGVQGVVKPETGLESNPFDLRSELAQNVQENPANQISVDLSLDQSYAGLQRQR